jgi:hypothetical protein
VESLVRNRTLARGVYRVNNPDLSSHKGISGDPREMNQNSDLLLCQRALPCSSSGISEHDRARAGYRNLGAWRGGLRTEPFLSPQCDPANGETKPTVHRLLGLSVGYADAGTKRLPVRPHTGLTATWLGQMQRLNLPRIATPQVSQPLTLGSKFSSRQLQKMVERHLGGDTKTPRLTRQSGRKLR